MISRALSYRRGLRAGSGPWEDASPEELARRYYDATTWMYRLAWGSSFHFSPLSRSEPRAAAIRRYERKLALELDIGPRSTCLDLGCGIGGPASTIEALCGARIVGVNSHLGQLRVLERRRRRRRRSKVRGVGAEFAALPFADGVFDRAYAFEALCHAVDLEAGLREVSRVLAPGGLLGFSEWCLTDAFDPSVEAHRSLRSTIEGAYGVVRLRSWPEWRDALANAGLRVVKSFDQAEDDVPGADQEPWYHGLLARDRTLDSVARHPAMRALQATALAAAERCGLAPRGTSATVRRLRKGTAALVEAGTRRIFTPMMFVVAAKDSR